MVLWLRKMLTWGNWLKDVYFPYSFCNSCSSPKLPTHKKLKNNTICSWKIKNGVTLLTLVLRNSNILLRHKKQDAQQYGSMLTFVWKRYSINGSILDFIPCMLFAYSGYKIVLKITLITKHLWQTCSLLQLFSAHNAHLESIDGEFKNSNVAFPEWILSLHSWCHYLAQALFCSLIVSWWPLWLQSFSCPTCQCHAVLETWSGWWAWPAVCPHRVQSKNLSWNKQS